MSEPKRYEPDHEGLMCPTPKGNYVLMQDYVRLKAENIRLKTEVEQLTDENQNLRLNISLLENDIKEGGINE